MAKETRPRSAPPRRKASAADTRKKKRRPAKKLKLRRVHRKLYTEFKPDGPRVSPFKPLRFTQLQRLQVLRWVLYIAVCILALVVQDTIMSRVSFLHATTDLAVAAILLIAVLEGSEIGSVFVLGASLIYYFSGSAPGPYSVGMLTVFGVIATVLRQQYLHRSPSSIILSAGLAAVAYEVGLYAVGLFLGLTRWYRLPRFFLTGIFTVAAMIPLYHLIYRIGLIGGNTWKE